MRVRAQLAAVGGAAILLLAGCTGSTDPAPSTPSQTAGVPDALDARVLPAETPSTTGWFRLQTLFSQESNRCLEANTPTDDAYLGGSSFMDDCQNVTGQTWQVQTSDQEGYLRLQPQSGVSDNLCLDGSAAGSPTRLSPCSNDSTQQWRMVRTDGGLVLQSQDAALSNLCLEGNQVGPGALQDGAAFQDDCQSVTGQVWVMSAVDDAPTDAAAARDLLDLRDALAVSLSEDLTVRYQLQSTTNGTASCLAGGDADNPARLAGCATDPSQLWQIVPTSRPDLYRLQSESAASQLLCLAGADVDPTAAFGGAARQVPCADDPAQQWRFVIDGDGYRLQPNSQVPENGCLEGNPAGTDNRLDGASFVDLCQNVTGQLWTLVAVPGTEAVPADAPLR